MSLVAADVALVPLACERMALEGLAQAFRTIETVKRRLNRDLSRRLLLTMIDGRLSDGQQIAADLRDRFGAEVLETTIRTSAKLKEGLPILDNDPRGKSAADYCALAAEVRTI